MHGTQSSELTLCPLTLAEAKVYVERVHRHHAPPVGHKFSIGCAAGDEIVGVVIVGRPVARMLDNGLTLEVTRCATDGTPNAASMLYSAAWRAAKNLGYRLITYTRAGESGGSLRGAGWRVLAERSARPGWNMPSRPRVDTSTTHGVQRTLWEAA